MVYTNVTTSTNIGIQEEKRQDFNRKFEEIGSYPSSYITQDFNTGAQIYNKTFLQEDIAELFIEVQESILNKGGQEEEAYKEILEKYKSDPEIKEKLQFIIDCTISACTGSISPLSASSSTQKETTCIQTENMDVERKIYTINNIDCGIKARPIFDMAIYQDVLKVEMRNKWKNRRI